jgi:hypothetical protein
VGNPVGTAHVERGGGVGQGGTGGDAPRRRRDDGAERSAQCGDARRCRRRRRGPQRRRRAPTTSYMEGRGGAERKLGRETRGGRAHHKAAVAAMAARLAARSGRGVDAGVDERSTVRGGTAQGALRGKRGDGDETGAAASGGASFERCAENRGRGGSTVRTPHGVERAWGLAPTGRRCPDRA